MSTSIVTFARGVARSNRKSLTSPDRTERGDAIRFVKERFPVYVLCEAILAECLGWTDTQIERYFLAPAQVDALHPKGRSKGNRNKLEFILQDGKVIRQ